MSSDDKLSISRRHFILSVLSSLAVVTILPGCGFQLDSSQVAQQLSQTIGDPVAAKRFGDAYLRAYPDEAKIEILLNQINTDLVAEYGEGMDLDNPQLLAEHLDQQIRNDYRHSKAIQVDGWILSRTEARIYALIALL